MSLHSVLLISCKVFGILAVTVVSMNFVLFIIFVNKFFILQWNLLKVTVVVPGVM